MEESILKTIKQMLGLNADYTPFDEEIKVNINSAIVSVQQLGVGVQTDPFYISGYDETWDQLLDGSKWFESVKNLIYFKTKLAFDPPANGFLVTSIENQIAELEWRLNVQAEQKGSPLA